MSWHEFAARADAHYTRPEDRQEWCEEHEISTEWGEACPACMEEIEADEAYDRMKDERAERDL